MKGQAALLLVLLAVALVPSSSSAFETIRRIRRSPTSTPGKLVASKKTTTSTEPIYSTKTLSESTDSEISKILDADSKEILVENLRSEDEDANNEKKIKDVFGKVVMAQSKKASMKPVTTRTPISKSNPVAAAHGSYNTTDSQALKALLEAEDMVYANEDIDGDDEDDDEDEYDDEDEDEDEDEFEGDVNDEEGTLQGCPYYCRCIGQYAALTTARCSKLQMDQGFGSGIAHLKIESAGDIRLGPYALRKLGLEKLESISIVDTKIVELDRTAFDGLNELFVVNLTHNGLTYIHPDTFQNNSQLSLLTISDNPLKIPFSSAYLLDAPNVTELDFSSNHVTRLPGSAFAKMPNLAYISLRNNRLSNIEEDLFAPLNSLVELDLSHNNIEDLPYYLFEEKGLQTFRISNNNLMTLSSIRAPKLTTLDVSLNRLKIITKDDLNGVPYLDQLYLSGNNLKRIHQHAFSNLDQLTYLDLSNNNFVNLSEHHFRTNSRLQVLLLSDNPELGSLPIFRTNAQMFERYSIYRFECENCGLTFIAPGTFDAMPAMTRLNLARNKLSELPDNMMRSLTSLRELDLSMNRFDRLKDNMFEGATSLTKLSLAMNSFVDGLPVTPFLRTPNLIRLDVSYCGMQRVWSEPNMTLKSLRFLSLHKNRLTRITLKELRAMPNLSGLDLSRNKLHCDEDLRVAVEWLRDNNVTPTESSRAMGSMRHDFDYDDGFGSDTEGEPVSQWTDLAKKLCDSWEGGPPPRPAPRKTSKKTQIPNVQTVKSILQSGESPISNQPGTFIKFDFIDDDSNTELDYGQGDNNEKIVFAWDAQEKYEQFASLWPAILVILVTLSVLLLAIHMAVCLAKRRGRGPVIRTPIILRPSLVDNKNCGLVYKPLQEEIATPHMPKRGSFYSSSTFHYDKIVPESV